MFVLARVVSVGWVHDGWSVVHEGGSWLSGRGSTFVRGGNIGSGDCICAEPLLEVCWFSFVALVMMSSHGGSMLNNGSVLVVDVVVGNILS